MKRPLRTALLVFSLAVVAASSLAATATADEYYDSYTWPGSTNGWSVWWNDNPYTMSTEYPPGSNPAVLNGLSVTPTPPAAQEYTSGRGIWSYQAPGTTTISEATFNDIWHRNPNQKQCLRVALYKDSPIWIDGEDICDTGEQNWPEGIDLSDPSSQAKWAQLWLHTGACTPGDDCPTIPPWTFFGSAYANAGSVNLTLVDNEIPTATLSGALKNQEGNWLLNEGVFNTTVSAHDPGSGVKYLALYANGGDPVGDKYSNCDASHATYPNGEICPYDDSGTWPIDLASYEEGALDIEAFVRDYSEEDGEGAFTVYVDTAPPEIELSNVLPALADQWVTSASNYEITIGGTDSGSGIRKITLLTDDPIRGTQVVHTYDSTCNFSAPEGEYCPYSDEATWEMDLSNYPQGDVTIIAKVEDLTGRETQESFDIKVDTMPPPAPENEKVEGEDGGATISWDEVQLAPDDTGSPFKGYAVRYSRTDGQSWEPWQETENTEKHVTDVPVGTEVQFEVVSQDEAGWNSDLTLASGPTYTPKADKKPKVKPPKKAKVKHGKTQSRDTSGRPIDFVPWTYQTRDGWKSGPKCHGNTDGEHEGKIKDPINIVVYNGANWKKARYWSRTKGTKWLANVNGGKQCAWVRAARDKQNVDIGTKDCKTCPRYHARFFQTTNSSTRTWTAIAVHRELKNHRPDPDINWPRAKKKLLKHFRKNGCRIKEIRAIDATTGPKNSKNGEGFKAQRFFQRVWNDGKIAYVDKQTCSKKKAKKASKKRKSAKKKCSKLKRKLRSYRKKHNRYKRKAVRHQRKLTRTQGKIYTVKKRIRSYSKKLKRLSKKRRYNKRRNKLYRKRKTQKRKLSRLYTKRKKQRSNVRKNKRNRKMYFSKVSTVKGQMKKAGCR